MKNNQDSLRNIVVFYLFLGNDKKQCKCGSANCSGYLGVKPKSQHALSVAEKAQNKKKKEKERRKLKIQKKKEQAIGNYDFMKLCFIVIFMRTIEQQFLQYRLYLLETESCLVAF